MGFGLLAFASILLLFSHRVLCLITNSYLGLQSFYYLFTFMGLYQVQRRIRNKKIYLAIGCSVIMSIMVFALPDTLLRYLTDIIEPFIFLCVLYGVKKECSIRLQKRIHRFTILYLSMLLLAVAAAFVINVPISLAQADQLTQAIIFLLTILRFISSIMLILLCIAINKELMNLEITAYHEIQISHTKQHTFGMLLTAVMAILILFLTQGIYTESLHQSKENKKAVLYESNLVDHMRIVGSGTMFTLGNNQTIYEFDTLKLRIDQEEVPENVYYIASDFSWDDEMLLTTQELNEMHYALIEKTEDGGCDISSKLLLTSNSFEQKPGKQLLLHLRLYDSEKHLIQKAVFPIQQKELKTYHGSKDGITIEHLTCGTTMMIRSPDISISILSLSKYRDYDTIKVQILYYQNQKMTAQSNTMTYENLTYLPFHPGYRIYRTLEQSAHYGMITDQEAEYDQAMLQMTFQGDGQSDKIIKIPLEPAS